MPIVDNIIGIVRGINDRSKAAKVDDAIRQNWMTAPDEAIKQAIQIDPQRGFALQDEQTARTTAADNARRARLKENTDQMARFLRGAPPDSDYGALIDQVAPLFKSQLGVNDDEIANFKATLKASPGILAGLDEDSYKQMAKDRYSDTVATPGAFVRRGGKTVEKVPYAPKAVVVRGGDGSSEVRLFNPNEYLADGSEAMPRGVAPDAPAASPPGGGLGDDEAGQILGDAMRNKVIGESDARVIRNSLGANGAQAYNNWLKENGIRVVPDGTAARAPVAPQADALPMQKVQPAPATRAAPQSGDRIGPPTAPKPAKRLRPATPQELAGYPPGTAAQIDETTGEMKNLRTPPASALPKPKTAAQEYKELQAQQTYVAKAQQVDQTYGQLESYAKRLINHPGMDGATGAIEGRLPGWAIGQDAQDFINEVEAMKSNIGLSKLMELKAGSSQGASGLGNLSNAEGERLERAFGSLERTSSPEVIKRSLRTIMEIAAKKRAEAQAGIKRGAPPTPVASSAPAGKPKLQLGARIRDKATGRMAILDNSGWVWEDTGQPVGGRKK